MPMEGSSEEYEKLALAALKKAMSPDSDATYHNNRAAIFAHPAVAAASSEMSESLKGMAVGGTVPSPTPAPAATGSPVAPAPAHPARRTPPTDPLAYPPEPPPGNGSAPGTALVPRMAD